MEVQEIRPRFNLQKLLNWIAAFVQALTFKSSKIQKSPFLLLILGAFLFLSGLFLGSIFTGKKTSNDLDLHRDRDLETLSTPLSEAETQKFEPIEEDPSLDNLTSLEEVVSRLKALYGSWFKIEAPEPLSLEIDRKEDVNPEEIKDKHFIYLLRNMARMLKKISILIQKLRVSCERCELTSESFIYLSEAISNQSLQHLFLHFLVTRCTQLDNSAILRLSEAMSTQSLSLIHLNFADISQLDDIAFESILRVISEQPIQHIHFDFNWWKVTHKSFLHLKEVFSDKSLGFLHLNFLGSCQIGNKGVEEVANAISTQSLKELALIFGRCPELNDQAVESLSKVLSTQSHIHRLLLNFEWNPSITENGIETLANAIKSSKMTLQFLELEFDSTLNPSKEQLKETFKEVPELVIR